MNGTESRGVENCLASAFPINWSVSSVGIWLCNRLNSDSVLFAYDSVAVCSILVIRIYSVPMPLFHLVSINCFSFSFFHFSVASPTYKNHVCRQQLETSLPGRKLLNRRNTSGLDMVLVFIIV